MPGSSPGAVRAVASGQVGDRHVVAVGYDDDTLAVVDLGSGAPIFRMSSITVVALRTAPPPGPPLLVCSGEDGTLSCFDLEGLRWTTSNCRLFTLPQPPQFDVVHLDGKRVLVAIGFDADDEHATIRTWDLDGGTVLDDLVATLEEDERVGPSRAFPACLAAGRVDGRDVVVWMGGGSAVRVWDLRSGEVLRTGYVEDGHRMATHHVSVERLHGQDVIVSGGYAGALSLWNLSGTISTTIEIGHATSGVPPAHHPARPPRRTRPVTVRRYGREP